MRAFDHGRASRDRATTSATTSCRLSSATRKLLRVSRSVDENKKETAYWRDIGTLDSYYEASMDLVAVEPVFNLYDKEWPIRTMMQPAAPAKTVFAQEEPGGRLGIVLDSLVSGGVIVSGGRVERSRPRARGPRQLLRQGRGLRADGRRGRRPPRARHEAIVDKGVRIPGELRRRRGPGRGQAPFHGDPGGVVVIRARPARLAGQVRYPSPLPATILAPFPTKEVPWPFTTS